MNLTRSNLTVVPLELNWLVIVTAVAEAEVVEIARPEVVVEVVEAEAVTAKKIVVGSVIFLVNAGKEEAKRNAGS